MSPFFFFFHLIQSLHLCFLLLSPLSLQPSSLSPSFCSLFTLRYLLHFTTNFLSSFTSLLTLPTSHPVLARDCDSGINSEISYFVPSSDFSITSGGVVSPARRLDYERPNHIYEFLVVAVDAGTPPRTGTASIRIRVANTNDEAPIFSQSV